MLSVDETLESASCSCALLIRTERARRAGRAARSRPPSPKAVQPGNPVERGGHPGGDLGHGGDHAQHRCANWSGEHGRCHRTVRAPVCL